jgi:tRNA uridine 5-carboxymethylaminomethyl modification enzyme
VGIEAVLDAMREQLAQEPLLAEWAATTNTGPSTAQVAKNATCSAQDDSFMLPTLDGDITLKRSSMRNEARAVETEIKFAGYLEQQTKSIAKLKAAEALAIPEWLDYSIISGLSREMREKLERVRPATIGQASRMPGVTPAALSLVHVSIRVQETKRLAS